MVTYLRENIIFITSADPFLHILCIIFSKSMFTSLKSAITNIVHFLCQENEIPMVPMYFRKSVYEVLYQTLTAEI